MKNAAMMLFVLFGICSNTWANHHESSKVIPQEKQQNLTPERALQLLKEGNQRFLSGNLRQQNYAKEMKTTAKKGQFPLGIVLSCIDSRSIPEVLFNQGLGNLFVSRMAGNVADTDFLGSTEFATKLAGARLVLVMGHTRCGAVSGACAMKDSTELKHLDTLLGKIKPAVNTVKKDDPNGNCQDSAFIDKITKQNVLDQMQFIVKTSPALAKMVDQKQIMLVGAMHDIRTGKVTFFNMQGQEI